MFNPHQRRVYEGFSVLNTNDAWETLLWFMGKADRRH